MGQILVTGATGFIGSLLVSALQKKYDQIYFERFDVTNKKQVEDVVTKIRPAVVYHLASPTNVDACEQNPELATRTILTGTENILQSIHGPCRFINASSMMVYHQPKRGKHLLTEESEISPANHYAKAKLKAENAVEDWATNLKNNYYNLRIFPHTHRTQKGSRFLGRLLAQFENNNSVTLPQSLNNCGRDIGAATDLVSCLFQLADAQINSGIYNVCTGRARNLGRLAQLMAERLDKKLRFEGPEEDENLFCGSYEKLNLATQWVPRFLTDDDLINYYLGEAPLL